MTLEELRRLDADVAEKVFGYTILWVRDPWVDDHPVAYLHDVTAMRSGPRSTVARLVGADWRTLTTLDGVTVEFFGRLVPDYSSNISVAWSAEVEIERRGLESRYVSCLMDLLEQEYKEHHLNLTMFSYIHATPEQRCRAALAAVASPDGPGQPEQP